MARGCGPRKERSHGGCHFSVSGPITGTDRTLSSKRACLAQQSQGAVVARIGDTVVLATANAAKDVREGIDFFPLTVDVEERMYAAGQDPRLVLPPGGPADRPGHPDGPADRPPAAAVVQGRLPQRDPGRGHHPGRRPGEPPRRAGHQRRQRRPDALGHPLRGPARRGAHRLHHRGRVDRPSDLPAGRRLDLRVGRGRPPADAERRRCRHHDGRGRRAPRRPGSTTRTAPRS